MTALPVKTSRVRASRSLHKGLTVAAMTLLALVYIYPVLLMVFNSFKPFKEVLLNVLALPNRLAFDNYAYVIDQQNKAEKREVVLGQVIGEYVVITSGLEVGDKIVTSGAENLEEGSLVEIRK